MDDRRVAGIRATSPGYRTATIEPDLETAVDAVRAHVGTPYGRLAAAWFRDGDTPTVSPRRWSRPPAS